MGCLVQGLVRLFSCRVEPGQTPKLVLGMTIRDFTDFTKYVMFTKFTRKSTAEKTCFAASVGVNS